MKPRAMFPLPLKAAYTPGPKPSSKTLQGLPKPLRSALTSLLKD